MDQSVSGLSFQSPSSDPGLCTGQCDFNGLNAKDIMQYGVDSVGKDDSVYRAIEITLEKGISCLPVVDGNRLVGIISEKDLLKLLYERDIIRARVSDYMTRDVVWYDLESDVESIRASLVYNHFRSVPIMCKDRLVGMISRADLIRSQKDRLIPESLRDDHYRRKDEVTAGRAMRSRVFMAKAYSPLYQVVDIMVTHRISCLPVVDRDNNLAGILTEKDILPTIISSTCNCSLASHHMTRDVVCFEQHETLYNVCDCLMVNSFRQVPIVDDGKPVGLISRADIMAYILRNRMAVFQRRREDLSPTRASDKTC